MIYVASEQEFNSLIVDRVFVEFMTSDCKACSLAEPFLIELQKSYPFKVAIVDINNMIKLVQKYQISVVPTFIMFEEQKELFRVAGFANKFDIEKLIRRFR